MVNLNLEADRKAEQNGAPVFVYYFTHTVPARGGKLGAPHTAEIPYAFDSLAHAEPLIGAVTPKEQALADKVSLAWTNFAKTGNPSNKLMPKWKPYNTKERPIMVIDDRLSSWMTPCMTRESSLASCALNISRRPEPDALNIASVSAA